MTRWAPWMSCWAALTVDPSASCRNNWRSYDRNLPCPYFLVSISFLLTWNRRKNRNLSIFILYYRNHPSIPKRTRGCACPAAAVSPSLAAKHGAGGHKCAARHAPFLHYGKRSMKWLILFENRRRIQTFAPFYPLAVFSGFRDARTTRGHRFNGGNGNDSEQSLLHHSQGMTIYCLSSRHSGWTLIFNCFHCSSPTPIHATSRSCGAHFASSGRTIWRLSCATW